MPALGLRLKDKNGLPFARKWGMKRVSFRVHPERGWIRTTISPINARNEGKFGAMDTLMFAALIAMVVAVARLFIAH